MVFGAFPGGGGAHAKSDDLKHLESARHLVLLDNNDVIEAHLARGFDRLAGNSDVAMPARIRRQAAGFENPRGPKPPVNANGISS